MTTFVQPLFQAAKGETAGNFVLSGSKVVTAGNTIFVGLAGQFVGVRALSDNLGNTYSPVFDKSGLQTGTSCLYRADVTKPGTLTAITLATSGFTQYAGIAVEFSGVGALRGSPSFSATTDNTQYPAVNAVPGGALANTAPYQAGDLWIGVFNQASALAFASDTGSSAVAAAEPSPEQATAGNSVGLLYYLSPSGLAAARLAGRWSSSAFALAIGAVFQSVPTGIINNDVVAGAIVLTGTRVETWKRAFNDAPSGPLALSGTSVDKSGRGFVDSPAGSLAFTASIVESFRRAFNDARTGALPLAGTAVDSWILRHVFIDARTGGLPLSGLAVDSWAVPKNFSDSPVGTLALAGTCNATYARKEAVNGSIAITGSVVEHPGYGDKPVGRIQLWDWAAEHPSNVPRPVGIPGALATSVLHGTFGTGAVVNPTVLRPSPGSGYAIGDLLICFAAVNSATPSGLTAVSSGWTASKVPPAGVGETPHRLYLVTKPAESLDEPPPTLTFTTTPGVGGTPAMARIVAFRGLDTVNLVDVISVSDVNTGPGVAVGGRPITTTLPNDLLLSVSDVLDDAAAHTVQPPTGFTMLTWDAVDSGRGMLGGWAYQVKTAPGVAPTPAFTLSGSQTNVSGGIQFALRAARVVGTIALSGSVQERYGHTRSVAGSLRLAGSRVEGKSYADKPQGAVAVAGSVVERYLPPTVDGTLPLTGTVQESWSHVGAFTGRIAFSGTVVEERFFDDQISGSLAVTGTSKDSLEHDDVCKAVLALVGVVSERFAFNVYPRGTVKLVGRNSEFVTIEGAIFYDDFPGGLLPINGRTVFVDYTPEPGRSGRVIPGFGGRVVRGSDTGRAVGNLTGRLT
jgi:hypothetical protein